MPRPLLRGRVGYRRMDFGIRFLSSYLVSGLDEAQAGIKRAGRNINNLRYADDSTLMRESEEELPSLLMTVKEEREKLA